MSVVAACAVGVSAADIHRSAAQADRGEVARTTEPFASGRWISLGGAAPLPVESLVSPTTPSDLLPFPSPPPLRSFLAVTDTTDRIPPDTQGAVGLEHVMTTLNTTVRFHTKEGRSIRTVSLAEFWSSLENPDPFDPRSIYDPFGDRWIFTACANLKRPDSALLLGVSKSSDPTGEWNLYRFDSGDETVWFDFPSVGFNRKWIAVQVIMKTSADESFAEARIYAFDKADLYAGGSGNHTLFRDSSIGRVLVPAVTHDADLDELYFVTSPDMSDEPVNSIQLFALEGEVGAERFIPVRSFTSAEDWAAQPPGIGNFAPQRASRFKIHLQESSILSATYRNGSIWCVHHVFLPATDPQRSSVQWWELRPDQLVQRGRIDDPSGARFFGYPSLAVNQFNDALIGYSTFGADQFPSAGYSLRLAGDPPGRTRRSTELKAGEGPYLKTLGTGKNRWGDFSSTVVDPSDDTGFWTIQEYSLPPLTDAGTSGESGQWSTWWGQISPELPEVDLRVSVTPSTESPRLNEELRYQIVVSNAGPSAATHVTVEDRLSPGILFVSSVAPDGECAYADGQVVCVFDQIDPDTSVELTVTVSIHSGSIIDNETIVYSLERDRDPVNNLYRDRVLVANPEEDSDGDGLPDTWESAHGLNPDDASDAELDPDGDGHSNSEEFVAGTDPHDPESVLRFSEVSHNAETVQLTFRTADGVVYAVEWAADLDAPLWKMLETVSGTGERVDIRDPLAGTTEERFYRLRTIDR